MTLLSRHQKMRTLGLRNLEEIHYQLSTTDLGEWAVFADEQPAITEDSRKTENRFIVRDAVTSAHLNWGDKDQPFEPHAFGWMVQKVEDYLKGKAVFVQDLYAGSDPAWPTRLRVITETAVHSLYTRQLCETPSYRDLTMFSPDFTIIHVPYMQADPAHDHTNTEAFTLIHMGKRLVLIGGTEDAREIDRTIQDVITLQNQQQQQYAATAS